MKPYEEVVEYWVREFISTMDEGELRPGNQSGVEPLGVKIIFDGYGDLETDEEYIEGGELANVVLCRVCTPRFFEWTRVSRA